MKNIRLSFKIILLVDIIVVLTIGLAIVGVIGLQNIQNESVSMHEATMSIVSVCDMRSNFLRQVASSQELYVNNDNPDKIDEIKKALVQDKIEMADFISGYEIFLSDNDLTDEIFTKFKKSYNSDYLPLLQKILDNAGNLTQKQITEFIESDVHHAMSDSMNTKYKTYLGEINSGAVHAKQTYTNMSLVLIIVSVVVILVALGISFYMPFLIAFPVRHMSEVANAIALGDMDVHLNKLNRGDEIGKLQESLQSMKDSIRDQIAVVESLADADLTVTPGLRGENDIFGKSLVKLADNLNKIVLEVSAVAEKVALESQHVAEESQELAQGTAEQASSIEELSSVVYEISLNTKENAALAAKASKLSGEVHNSAVEGENLIAQMIKAVKDTAVASKNIEKIIKVIEEIAFQTNILALNAAVEAAHAGQNGNGFAVVAAEVRSLASKSAESAKDTGELISKTLEQVSIGADLSQHTADSFKVILKGIEESTLLISDIAKSSEEQAIAIEQINTGISQVAQVINLNSGTAEKCAGAAEKMNDQSNKLEQTVAKFRTKGSANNNSESSGKKAVKPRIKIDMSPDIPNNDFGKY